MLLDSYKGIVGNHRGRFGILRKSGNDVAPISLHYIFSPFYYDVLLSFGSGKGYQMILPINLCKWETEE